MSDNAYQHVNSAAMPVDEAVEQARANERRLQRMVWAMALVFLALFVWWGVQRPLFDIQKVQVRGDLKHHDQNALAERVLGKVQGNFFSADLHAIRAWVKQQPWIRKVVVHRGFPDVLVLDVFEHEGVALWGNVQQGQLVNAYGEVFNASVEASDVQQLPVFSGPDGMSSQVMSMYVTLNQVVAPLKSQIHRIELDDGGAWSMELVEGARVELGQGTEDSLQRRLSQFVGSLAVVNRVNRPVGLALIDSVDLRYPKGYALKLKEVKREQG